MNEKIRKRQKLAKRYERNLKNIVKCPNVNKENYNSYYSYTILVEKREKLIKFLKKNKIETKIQHPILINKQKAYLSFKDLDLPIAYNLVKKILCIPIHEKLTNKDVDYVSKKIKSFMPKIINHY